MTAVKCAALPAPPLLMVMVSGRRWASATTSANDRYGREGWAQMTCGPLPEQHRIEVLFGIERQVRNQKRINGLAVEAKQPRRAIGRRLRNQRRSGAAGGARPVVYDDDVAQSLLQTGLNDTRNHVDRTARRERNHDPDWRRRPRGRGGPR
jgi:hypothetical protein